MSEELDIQKVLDALAGQRNAALDQVAALQAQVAALKEHIEELTPTDADKC